MIDASKLIFVAYYAPQVVEVAENRLQEFTEQLKAQGYELINGYAFPFSNPNNILRNPEQIAEKISVICRQNSLGGTLYFWQYPFEFSFSLLFEPEEDTEWIISVEVDTLMGGENNLGAENALRFVEVIKIALAYFPPVYGCGFTLQNPPLPEDVYDLEVTELYPVNFYGTDYVQNLGEERLLTSPAWHVEKMSSGILLIPSLEAIYTDDPIILRKVAIHLGWLSEEDLEWE